MTNNERRICGDNSGGKSEYDSETHDGRVETGSSWEKESLGKVETMVQDFIFPRCSGTGEQCEYS